MEAAHRNSTRQLNQPSHIGNRVCQSPCATALIAFGIILAIGSAFAAGFYISHIGYHLTAYCFMIIGALITLVGMGCCIHERNQRQLNRLLDETGHPTSTTVDDDFSVDHQTIETIGSPEARLDENGICEELKKLKAREDIDVLVLYGDGAVAFNFDPGFVDLNPKKVILVGARIIHAQGHNRLDDQLSDKKNWLCQIRTGALGSMREATTIKQIEVSSVQEAIDHVPGKYSDTERYHTVYRVVEK